MRSISFRSIRTATEGAGARSRHPRRYAWGRALVMLLVLGLGSTPWLRAQKSMVATTMLMVHVVPEERIEVQAYAVSLRIRLAAGTTARLWADTSCGAAPLQSGIITSSGAYSILLEALGVTYSPRASEGVSICLLSSDGLLRDSVAIRGAVLTTLPPSLGTEASSLTVQQLQGSGLLTTRSAGVITASRP